VPRTPPDYYKLYTGNCIIYISLSFELLYNNISIENFLKILIELIFKMFVTLKASINNIYLLVHARQVIKAIKATKISNGKSEFTIDKNILAEGISDIIIFNDQLKPVCERLYFKRPDRQLEVVLNADRQEYTKRNMVNFQLQTTDQFKKPVKADLSLSVYLIDSVQSYQEESIRSYLWLSSELSGNIEEPDYYFSSARNYAGLDNDLEVILLDLF
jgi:hypothetical protein